MLGKDDDPSSVAVDLPKLDQRDLVVQEIEGVGARVTVSLSRLTAPGAYEGKLRVGGTERPLLIEVEPRVRLGIDPRRLYFQAASEAKVEADVTFTNLGNVALELPAEGALTLLQMGGFSGAIGRAATGEAAKGQRRIDALAEAAAEAVGGVVRIKIDGAGELGPGETRAVHLTLTLPDRLEPGRTYWGTWAVHNVNYVVRVEATASPQVSQARRTRKGAG
jgi:hypothetical protein